MLLYKCIINNNSSFSLFLFSKDNPHNELFIVNRLSKLTAYNMRISLVIISTVYWTWPPTKDEFHWLSTSGDHEMTSNQRKTILALLYAIIDIADVVTNNSKHFWPGDEVNTCFSKDCCTKLNLILHSEYEENDFWFFSSRKLSICRIGNFVDCFNKHTFGRYIFCTHQMTVWTKFVFIPS